ncbi:Uncharacterised protein [uncultured archaeon]|nr:Uncharacterised protein [uncultured archaeon]
MLLLATGVRELICEHKSCGEVMWLPHEFRGRQRGLKPHPFCSECGLVKNISSDRPRSIGHYLNILGHLSAAYCLSRVQIRLISRELSCLDDPYGFCRHQQEEIFKDIILKHTKIPERSIKGTL